MTQPHKKIPYADLAGMQMGEDDRIRVIGTKVTKERVIVSVLVDDEPGKMERYIKKLKDRFPGIRIGAKGKGPTKGAQWFKVAPPVASEN